MTATPDAKNMGAGNMGAGNMAAEKLPLWRAITGFGVLAAMAAVLLGLAPTYLENYRLQQYLNGMAHEAGLGTASDDAVRGEIVARARELSLPVATGDIRIARTGGAVKVEMRYVVAMNLALYRVDLHFHPGFSATIAAGAPEPAR